MPLKTGTSKKTFKGNVGEFHGGKTYARTKAKYGAKRANAQAVAVAYAKQREAQAKKHSTIKQVMSERAKG